MFAPSIHELYVASLQIITNLEISNKALETEVENLRQSISFESFQKLREKNDLLEAKVKALVKFSEAQRKTTTECTDRVRELEGINEELREKVKAWRSFNNDRGQMNDALQVSLDQAKKQIFAREAEVSRLQFQVDTWQLHNARQQAESKRLEKLCHDRYEAALVSAAKINTLQSQLNHAIQAPTVVAPTPSPSLDSRVTGLESRVTKLEESCVRAIPAEPSYPMNTIFFTDMHAGKCVQLFMGGEWVVGGRNRTSEEVLYSTCLEAQGGKSHNWDKANQPTCWKPLVK